MKSRLDFRFNTERTLCYEYYESGIVIRRARENDRVAFKDTCIGKGMPYVRYLIICGRYKCFASSDHARISLDKKGKL